MVGIGKNFTGAFVTSLVLITALVVGVRHEVSPAGTFHTENILVDVNTELKGNVGMCTDGTTTCANIPHFTFHPTTGQSDLSGTGAANYNTFRVLENVLETTIAATASQQLNQTIIQGTFDTTAGSLSTWAGEFGGDASRSAGANQLINTGVLLHARNGQVNYAADVTDGSIHSTATEGLLILGGPSVLTGGDITAGVHVTDLSASTSILLNSAVSNFEVPGTTAANPDVGIGTASPSDGTQFQTKNTRTGVSTNANGIDIGLDTTVEAGVRGGLFITRGAAGSFNANQKGLWVGPGNTLTPNEAANDMTIYNVEASKSLLFLVGGTGAAHTIAKMDGATGRISIGSPSGTPIILSPIAPTGVNHGSLSTGATDWRGDITTIGANTSVTLTYSSAFPTRSRCTVTPLSSSVAIEQIIPAPTNSNVVFTCTAIVTGASANCDDFSYDCVGQ